MLELLLLMFLFVCFLLHRHSGHLGFSFFLGYKTNIFIALHLFKWKHFLHIQYFNDI